MKSITIKAEDAFKAESILDIIAAINPAKTIPITPGGNNVTTISAKTKSEFSNPGKSVAAKSPRLEGERGVVRESRAR